MSLRFIKSQYQKTIAQSNSLHQIATRCPQIYGDPVEWARLILSQEEQTNYDETVNCNGPQLRPIAEDPAENDINGLVTLSPNPSSDRVSLKYEIELDAILFIYNIQGQLMQKTTLSPESQQRNLSIADLNAGMYYLVLRDQTSE